MPQISDKAVRMPTSPIRKLAPYAEAAKARGTHVIHLNIGQPDIETPSLALDAIRNYSDTIIAYSPSTGLPSYRKKLAAYYSAMGRAVKEEHIIVTTGGSEAIRMVLDTCCDEGDEIIVPEPFYANYNGFATSSSVKVVPVTSHIESDFALPPIQEMEAKISDSTRAILLCNPNNPTGYIYTKQEIEAICLLAKKYDLYIFCDEVYRDFCYTDDDFVSFLDIEGLEEHIVICDSMSKKFSACGIRVGCIITRNEEVIAGASKYAQARLCAPRLGQIAAEAALDTPQSYFDEVYKEYLSRRDYVVSRLQTMEGVYAPKPRGAFYVIARLPVEDAEHFAQWLLEDFAYRGATLMVAPASGFYFTEGLGKDEIRIAYVLNTKELERAMDTLEEGLMAYASR